MDVTPTNNPITPIFKDIGEYVITLVFTVFLFLIFIIMSVLSVFRLKKINRFSVGNNLIYLITLILLGKIVYNIYLLSKYVKPTDKQT